MTLDKRAARAMLEEYFTDYGPDRRFILDLGPRNFYLKAQVAKERIPHPHQKGMTNSKFGKMGFVDAEI